MSYIVNDGEIAVNKVLTEEVAGKINAILGGDYCEAGKPVIWIDDLYDKYFDETIQNVIDEIAPLGYVLDGYVNYSGDWEGRVEIINNKVTDLSLEECAICDADDETLIRELVSRGYVVTKAS